MVRVDITATHYCRGLMPSDILPIIESTGGRFNKASSTRGGIYKGPCPWCGGNDRFSIYPNDGAGWYICNQCKRTGDVIQFYMEYSGLTFKEACERSGQSEKLSEQRKQTQKKHAGVDEWEPRTVEPPNPVWVKKAESFLFSSYKFLLSAQGKKHRDYLNSRGIVDETIKRARLGYNPSPVQFGYDAFGLPPETDKSGKNKTVWIPDGIVIPYYDQSGLKRIRIRNANPHGKNRYVLLTGGTTEYLIYPDSDNSKKTVAVESELDGWLVWQEASDLVNVMALGNSTTRPDTAAFNILTSCPGIVCSLDHDDAGLVESVWWKDNLKATWWPVPKGKDPGEAFVLGVDLKEWVSRGICPYELKPVAVVAAQGGVDEQGPVYSYPEPAPIQKTLPETNNQTDPEKHETRKITVTHISEKTTCRLGEPCIHIGHGQCLLSGEYVHHTRVCLKKKWWICADQDCGIEVLVKGYRSKR